MGFLDKQEDIMDMVLTAEGRRQLASGELRFVSYAFFDDSIDYSPVVTNSGSLTQEALDQMTVDQIESWCGMEPSVGSIDYNRDHACMRSKLFTMPQNQQVLPRLSISHTDRSGSIQVDRKAKLTLRTSKMSVDIGVDDFFPTFMQDGALVRVFTSGSEGLVELEEKLDDLGRSSYGPELIVSVDGA